MKNHYQLLFRINFSFIILFASIFVRAQTINISAPTVYIQGSRIPIPVGNNSSNSLAVPLTVVVSRDRNAQAFDGTLEVYTQANGSKNILRTINTNGQWQLSPSGTEYRVVDIFNPTITNDMIDNFNAPSYITAQFTRNGGSTVISRIE